MSTQHVARASSDAPWIAIPDAWVHAYTSKGFEVARAENVPDVEHPTELGADFVPLELDDPTDDDQPDEGEDRPQGAAGGSSPSKGLDGLGLTASEKRELAAERARAAKLIALDPGPSRDFDALKRSTLPPVTTDTKPMQCVGCGARFPARPRDPGFCAQCRGGRAA